MSGFGSGFGCTNPSSGFSSNQSTSFNTPGGFGSSANVNNQTILGFPTPASTSFPSIMPSSSQPFSSSTSLLSTSPFHGDNNRSQVTSSAFGVNVNPSNNFTFGGNNASIMPSNNINSLPTFGFGTSSSLVKPTNPLPITSSLSSSLFPSGGGNGSIFSGPPSTSNTNPFSMPSSTQISSTSNTTFGSMLNTNTSFAFGGSGTSFNSSRTTTQPQLFSSSGNNNNSSSSSTSGNFHSFTSTIPAFGRSLIPSYEIKEEDMMGTTLSLSNAQQTLDSDFTDASAIITTELAITQQKEEELARLKAKIEEKKRLFHEKKQRFEASSIHTDMDIMGSALDVQGPIQLSTMNPFQAPIPRKLNPKASIFIPSTTAETVRADNNNNNHMHPDIQGIQSRAKSKFLNQNDPDGLDYDDLDDGELRPISMTESLVGTCPYMCPEEEWIRRENETDIQILEMPHSSIHPKGWTLRDTSVKRFRRSAADFKLDIPSLVRPPHILERVCSYLEEWVMERDRQGVDQRYIQMGRGSIPPSLDVYQFIWDRTRMIRKDFILQNFVGTGGRCSATAVRVHERIARWHCMSEHQLSHLPDFIPQSQQNIQELGQTMKTLNLYYDDALGRCTKEEVEYEFRHHGCMSTVVMGPSPIDYDGSALVNSPIFAQSHHRIIGLKDDSLSGTSEAEMRALYILLTANNDGGMEVIKYAGRLSVVRPDVSKSAPVKLAMEIFKAKKEFNYAKFFSLLRDPFTPYLFACVMFKYVEQMREVAFRMMSKTFGSRKKESLENTCDLYPLSDLVNLLCFEDQEEAKEACLHYNIVIELINNIETVLWKKSEFSKPRDPMKGTVLHLRPRKMIRTIESKLHGATRLAVCRGDLSRVCEITPSIGCEAINAIHLLPVKLQSSVQEISKLHVEKKDDFLFESNLSSDLASKREHHQSTFAPKESKINAVISALPTVENPIYGEIREAENLPERVTELKNESSPLQSFSFGSFPVQKNALTTSASLFSFSSSTQTDSKKNDTSAINFPAQENALTTSAPLFSFSSSTQTDSKKNDRFTINYPAQEHAQTTSASLFSFSSFTQTDSKKTDTSTMIHRSVTSKSIRDVMTDTSSLLPISPSVAAHPIDIPFTISEDGNGRSLTPSPSILSASLTGDATTDVLLASAPAFTLDRTSVASAPLVEKTNGDTLSAGVSILDSSCEGFKGLGFRPTVTIREASGKTDKLSYKDVTPMAAQITKVPTSRLASEEEVDIGRLEKETQHPTHIEEDRRQRLAAEEARQRLLQEEQFKKREALWKKKISTARKVFLVKKWLRTIDQRRSKRNETLSLQSAIDPSSNRLPLSPILNCDNSRMLIFSKEIERSEFVTLEDHLYRMGSNTSSLDFDSLFQRLQHGILQTDRTTLFTIGFSVIGETYLSELMQLWIESRVKSSCAQDISSSCRTIIVNCTYNIDMIDRCDAALLLIASNEYRGNSISLATVQAFSKAKIPRVILSFDDYYDKDNGVAMDLSCFEGCAKLHVDRTKQCESDLDHYLLQCFEFLIEEFVCRIRSGQYARVVEKISLGTLIYLLLTKVLRLSSHCDESEPFYLAHVLRNSYHEREVRIFNYMKSAIFAFFNELDSLLSILITSTFRSWPLNEFLDETNSVPNYFYDRSSLPSSWLYSLSRTTIECRVRENLPSIFNSSGSIFTFLDELTKNLHETAKQECVILLRKGQLHAACQRILDTAELLHSSQSTIYFPVGEITNIIDRVSQQLFPQTMPLPSTNSLLNNLSDNSRYMLDEERHKNTSPSFTSTKAAQYYTPESSNNNFDEEIGNNASVSPFMKPNVNRNAKTPASTEKYDCLLMSDPMISPIVNEDTIVSSKKRHRPELSAPSTHSTDEVECSKAFTAKLKSLLNEKTIYDIKIGSTYLSNILNNGDKLKLR